MQALASFEQFIETVVRTEFKENVDIVNVFEEVNKLCDVGMLDGPVDLDLTHELLLGPTSLKRRLVNDLGCSDLFGVALDEFIALGKASFAQELALNVLPEAHLPVLVFDFLLHDLGALVLL